MTRTRYPLAFFFLVALTNAAPAQFFPPPYYGVPVVQGGVQFRVGGPHLRISGFFPVGYARPAYVPYGYGYGYPLIASGFPFPGYGAINQRVIVQTINPTVVVQSRRVNVDETYDLSGIDLDVEPLEKIWGPKPGLANRPAPKKDELIRAPLPEKPVRIVEAPAKLPPPPPKVEPIPEGQRLIEKGIAAFRAGEYGLAILRFRQAAGAFPPGPRAAFLEGQACLAVGKYADAAQLIQKGLRANPDWPASAFRPKVELYDNNVNAWNEHRGALEKALKREPMNADYLFLLGYLAWFDGERAAAVDYFQQARVLAVEPRWSDAFLQVAKK